MCFIMLLVSFNIIHLTEFFEIQRAVFNSIAMFTIGQAVYRKLGPYEFWAVCAGGSKPPPSHLLLSVD